MRLPRPAPAPTAFRPRAGENEMALTLQTKPLLPRASHVTISLLGCATNQEIKQADARLRRHELKKGRTVLQAKRLGIHSCIPTTSLVSALRTMVEEEISSLVVLDEDGYLEGIITRMEILGAYLALDEWASELVQDHMTRDGVVVSPHTMLLEAARLMSERQVGQVVVALAEGEKQRPVALLNDADLAYHLVKGS